MEFIEMSDVGFELEYNDGDGVKDFEFISLEDPEKLAWAKTKIKNEIARLNSCLEKIEEMELRWNSIKQIQNTLEKMKS